jgi:hypothetical protein
MSAAAADILAAVRSIGGDVKLVGSGRLKVVAPAPLSDDLIEQLRAVKPDLVLLLTPRTHTELPFESWTDAEEERAAIVEYEAGAPRAWAEASRGSIQASRQLACHQDVGCNLSTTAAVSSTADGRGKQQHSAGDRSIYLAAIGSGHSLASIIRACFGSSTAGSWWR